MALLSSPSSPVADNSCESVCIICGQAAGETIDKSDEIKKFIKYFSKFTTGKGDGTLIKLVLEEDQQLAEEGEEKLECCGNCEQIVDQFGLVYCQVKELEKQLSGIGDSLVKIIKSAGYENSYQNDYDYMTGNGRNLFKEFKKLIRKRGMQLYF